MCYVILQPFLYNVFMWCIDSVVTLGQICIHIWTWPIGKGVSQIYPFW